MILLSVLKLERYPPYVVIGIAIVATGDIAVQTRHSTNT